MAARVFFYVMIVLSISFKANGATIEVLSRGAIDFVVANNNILFSDIGSSTPLNFKRAVPFEESDNTVMISGHSEAEAWVELTSSEGVETHQLSGEFEVEFQYSALPDYSLRSDDSMGWTTIAVRSHAEAVSEILRGHDGEPTCMLQALARVRSSFRSDLTIPTLENVRVTDVASYDFAAEAGCEKSFTISVGFCTTGSALRELCAISETTPDTYGLVYLLTADGAAVFNALSRRELISTVRN
jgi:hypothetical protein